MIGTGWIIQNFAFVMEEFIPVLGVTEYLICFVFVHLGHSALHLAAKNSHPDCIKRLLQVE